MGYELDMTLEDICDETEYIPGEDPLPDCYDPDNPDDYLDESPITSGFFYVPRKVGK